MTEVRPGQVWEDRDKRREQNGTVRRLTVQAVGLTWTTCTDASGKVHTVRRRRFGSNAANDSFRLVRDVSND